MTTVVKFMTHVINVNSGLQKTEKNGTFTASKVGVLNVTYITFRIGGRVVSSTLRFWVLRKSWHALAAVFNCGLSPNRKCFHVGLTRRVTKCDSPSPGNLILTNPNKKSQSIARRVMPTVLESKCQWSIAQRTLFAHSRNWQFSPNCS